MTSKRIQHLLYTLLVITGIIRRSKCELPVSSFEGSEHDEYLNEYLFFDDSRYLTELDDTMLEIDLINRNRRHKFTHEEPRILYQIGVSQSPDFFHLIDNMRLSSFQLPRILVNSTA